jgi:hypothetical protein
MLRHPIYKVSSFQKVAPYILRVRFNDRTERTIDFHPILVGELFGPLQDLKLFNRVRIDSEVHTLVWPNGTDFDPANLHDWQAYVRAFSAVSHRWRLKKPVKGKHNKAR